MPDLLTREIRAAKPVASDELRERVRAIAARGPEPQPSFLARLLPTRRLLLVAAPAAVAVGLLSAATIGVLRSEDPGREAIGAQTAPAKGSAGGGGAYGSAGPVADSAAPESAEALRATDQSAQLPPTDPSRLQRFDAQLRIRVGGTEELSRATVRAMTIARSLGGYVAAVSYATPERGLGTAELVLRVPSTRAQAAIVRFSQLGTILSQQVQIEDLQTQVDDLGAREVELRRQIADLERRLRSGSLAEEERILLQQQLTDARHQLGDIRGAKQQTTREGRLATFSLSLTTEKAAAAQDDGRLERTLDEAKAILAWEAAALLYALVVVGPFLLLGTLVWLALRLRRRREEARLLERT